MFEVPHLPADRGGAADAAWPTPSYGQSAAHRTPKPQPHALKKRPPAVSTTSQGTKNPQSHGDLNVGEPKGCGEGRRRESSPVEEFNFLVRGEPHDALDARAVVPRSVEDHELAAGGELLRVPLEKPLRFLPLRGRREGDDAANARGDSAGDAGDDPALARGVPAFEDDEDLAAGRGGGGGLDDCSKMAAQRPVVAAAMQSTGGKSSGREAPCAAAPSCCCGGSTRTCAGRWGSQSSVTLRTTAAEHAMPVRKERGGQNESDPSGSYIFTSSI